MLQEDFLAAALPLFSNDEVEILEWSPDIGWSYRRKNGPMSYSIFQLNSQPVWSWRELLTAQRRLDSRRHRMAKALSAN